MRNTATRTISVKLPAKLDARIRKLAKTRGTTRSALVRQAIESIDLEGESGSFLAVAGDLAGSVEGPRDLSKGARHMNGYGE